jgi:hypothetical protein
MARTTWVGGAFLCLTLLSSSGVTHAAGKSPARAAQKQAAAMATAGDYDAALAVLGQALAAAPGDLELLQLRASILLETRDFEGALAAYEAFLAAGAKGANKRAAEKIVANLRAAGSTFLHVRIVNGPAKVYLDSKSLGVFCVAAPEADCRRSMLPGTYKLIVERDGHEKLAERVVVKAGEVLDVERTLIEKPSAFTVTTNPAGASVTVDGQAAGTSLAPGEHVVEASLAGHARVRQKVAAHEGLPVQLSVKLSPTVPFALTNGDVKAEVLLDGQPARIEDGALVLATPGAHTVTVRARAFRVAIVDVPETRPEGFRVEVTLAPAPATVTVAGAPDGAVLLVDGRAVATLPLVKPIEIEAGTHAVELRADGYAAYRGQAVLAAASSQTLQLTHLESTSRPKAWTAASIAGVGVVSSLLFGALAYGAQESYDELAAMPGVTASDPRLADHRDRGRGYAVVSDVGLGVAAVAGGLAAYWFVSEGGGESHARFEPIVGPDVAGVGVRGRF